MLSFSNLTKSYSDKPVLNQINLTLSSATTTGLIGANGEGKTTLFKCLLDICHVDEGEIQIAHTTHNKCQARQHLAFLPEHFQAPHYLTGKQFLDLMLSLYDAEPNIGKLEHYLTTLLFDLTALKRPVRTYSKGMMQKLGITACLASEKPLLILDEPMSGLDPTARFAFKKLLLAQKQQGKTLIFSTHLLHDIESICDHIAILSNGHIRFHGPVDMALQQFQADTLEQAYINCLNNQPHVNAQ